VEPNVDLNSLDHRIRVRDAIQSGNIQSAVAMVNELHPELLDNDRFLFFHLQVRRIFYSNVAAIKMSLD
jgi:glucose-induced degradation protein 8